MSHLRSEAAYIDTDGSFSPFLLRRIIEHRLTVQSNQSKALGKRFSVTEQNQRTEGGMSNQVASLLDRVKLMRVFDMAGLSDAVGEVPETLTRSNAIRTVGIEENTDHYHQSKASDVANESDDAEPDFRGQWNRNGDGQSDSGDIGIRIIAIAGITNIVSAERSRSPLQGQATVASFMRSLRYLTTHYQLCTIIINAVVASNSSSKFRNDSSHEQNASIFASISGRPALGSSFAQMVDKSLLLSVISNVAGAAVRALHKSGSAGKGSKDVTLIEVLTDRLGSGAGRWAAFEIQGEIELVPYAVQG